MTTAPVLDAAILRAVTRLEDEVHALRQVVHDQGDALRALRATLLEDAAPPAPDAPLAAGGAASRGAAPADFPASFARRRGGGH